MKISVYSSEVSEEFELTNEQIKELNKGNITLAELVCTLSEDFQINEDNLVDFKPFKKEADKGEMDWDYTCTCVLED